MGLQFLETILFDMMMLFQDGVIALIDLVEDKPEYSSHGEIAGIERLKDILSSFKLTTIISESSISLYILSIFFPTIAVYLKRGKLMDAHVFLNIFASLIFLWPVSIAHALFIITFSESRVEKQVPILPEQSLATERKEDKDIAAGTTHTVQ